MDDSGQRELRTWDITRPDSAIEELVVEMAGEEEGEPEGLMLYERPANYTKLCALFDEGWGVMYPAPTQLLTIDGRTYAIPSGIIVMMGRTKAKRSGVERPRRLKRPKVTDYTI